MVIGFQKCVAMDILFQATISLVFFTRCMNCQSCQETNIALNKQAYQSTTLPDTNTTSHAASLAVDGDLSSGSQTEAGYIEWWYVDLEVPEYVAEVYITICSNCDAKFYRGNDFVVSSGLKKNAMKIAVSKIQTKQSSFSVALPDSPLVRYVEIKRYDRSSHSLPLLLSEVEVLRKAFSSNDSALLLMTPSFISTWKSITAQEGYELKFYHGFKDWPSKVSTEVRATSNNDVIIFKGRSGLITLYDAEKVSVYVGNLQSSYNASAWTGPTLNITNLEVRIKAWYDQDLPNPVFQSSWNFVDCQSESNVFLEIPYTLDDEPDTVMLQLNVTINNTTRYAQVEGIISESSLNGVAFGYNHEKVRIWIPFQDQKDAVFLLKIDDGLDYTNFTITNGYVRVVMWKYSLPLLKISIDPHVANLSAPYELPYDIELDNIMTSVKVVVNDTGSNDGFMFPTFGLPMSTSGLTYGLEAERVWLWRQTYGFILNIKEPFGAGKLSQFTNDVIVDIKYYKLYDKDDITCAVENETFPYADELQPKYNFRDTVTTTCPNGKSLDNGKLQRTCDRRCSWDGSPAVCKNTTCPDDDYHVINAIYMSSGRQVNDSVNYECDRGYYLSSGNITRICLSTGNWSGEKPVCKEIECPSDVIQSSPYVVKIQGNKYMDKAIFGCPPSLQYEGGDTERICQNDSTWSGSPLLCKRCYCKCEKSIDKDTRGIIVQRMKETVKELIVKKSTLSSAIRAKTSAPDDRPSATTVGSIGVIILAVTLAVIILPDIPVLYREIRSWPCYAHPLSSVSPFHEAEYNFQMEDQCDERPMPPSTGQSDEVFTPEEELISVIPSLSETFSQVDEIKNDFESEDVEQDDGQNETQTPQEDGHSLQSDVTVVDETVTTTEFDSDLSDTVDLSTI